MQRADYVTQGRNGMEDGTFQSPSASQGLNGSNLDNLKPTDGQEQVPLDLRAFIDRIPALVWSSLPDGAEDFFSQGFRDYTGFSADLFYGSSWRSAVHQDHIQQFENWWQSLLESQEARTTEVRLRRFDGDYRWFQITATPVQEEQGNKDESGEVIRWYVTAFDIDDRKRAEETLRAAEFSLRQTVDTIPGQVLRMSTTGEIEVANRQLLAYFGKNFEDIKKWTTSGIVHPDDLPQAIEISSKALASGDPYEITVRVRRFDGVYRWFHSRGLPLRDADGRILHWYSLNTDIDDQKKSEEALLSSERDLRLLINTIPTFIGVLRPDGSMLYANQTILDYTGLTPEDVQKEDFRSRMFHPEDVERLREERRDALLRAVPFENEQRMSGKDGSYRWFLIRYNPLLDERGGIDRWYATATDIDDRKRAEERLHNENLVLREEIDRSSMFEEIVGSSKPMSHLLKKVEKVAPSDSTVLILGETGTGKELIARALHRRSKRASRAFVKVNCAAIPQSLIASELFGHEKGAFTGALQRRVGRFEAANGGTLFLDEIGELPMETQIALLRVLQEREFERVGSNHPISVDVRVIAATNCDLPAAVAAGTFRQDLFFRLNVFPIAVPALRERVEDIPLLVEYFVGRFAKDAGKTIRHIGKKTLEQLQRYPWPGNIRELQNVVERAVILSERNTFVVDESWLESQTEESTSREGLSALEDREVEMIESALAETHGRISGPLGAAAKLGVPRQTLESKIRRLGIGKHRQQQPAAELLERRKVDPVRSPVET